MCINSKVLFTTQIDSEQLLDNRSFSIDIYNFTRIQIIDFQTPEVLSKHCVFTSKNAVEAVLDKVEIPSTQSIYAVGKKTKERLMRYNNFQNIKTPDNTENAKGIIRLIEQEKSNNFLYFCGKRRLPDLEQYFIEKGKDYKLLEVYDTILSPPENLKTENYEWLCFCSPSAIESYLQHYQLLPSHKILCIGQTTAKAIENYENKVCIAPKTSIASMLNYLDEYYKNKR